MRDLATAPARGIKQPRTNLIREPCSYLLIDAYIILKLGSVFGQAVDPFKPAEEIVFGVLKGLAGSVEKSKAE